MLLLKNNKEFVLTIRFNFFGTLEIKKFYSNPRSTYLKKDSDFSLKTANFVLL